MNDQKNEKPNQTTKEIKQVRNKRDCYGSEQGGKKATAAKRAVKKKPGTAAKASSEKFGDCCKASSEIWPKSLRWTNGYGTKMSENNDSVSVFVFKTEYSKKLNLEVEEMSERERERARETTSR